MKSIILISHSDKITEGSKEMIDEMVGDSPNVKVYSAGGTGDGRMGTNAVMVLECIEESSEADNILIFADIGSAILSAETAMELIEDDAVREKTMLVDAPLVEGSFAAAVLASTGASMEAIMTEMELL